MNLFRHSADVVSFAAGQTVFQEGEPGECAYGVQEGEVDIVLHGNVVDTAGPGDIIGEMALIDSLPRSASAVARTECKLVLVDEKRFAALVQQTPYFSLHVMKLMAERLRRYMSSSSR